MDRINDYVYHLEHSRTQNSWINNPHMENNYEISEDIFNFEYCVEEFALQSICCNLKPFYYVGNGCETISALQCDNKKLTHKKNR